MSSGFVSELEIAEAKKKRQEEWEKARNPDQPLEMPDDEPYDGRSLYDRLKEQKDKKDYDYEEAHKLKNLIRGLDDDEVDFLDVIDKAKSIAEKKQQIEENREMKDFRERVATIQEKNLDNKIQAEIAKPKVTKTLTRPSQKNLLSGMVRKRTATTAETSNGAKDSAAAADTSNGAKDSAAAAAETAEPVAKKVNSTAATATDILSKLPANGALRCIGILPGIGRYRESSDSEKSTDTEDDCDFSSYDWVGKKINQKPCSEK